MVWRNYRRKEATADEVAEQALDKLETEWLESEAEYVLHVLEEVDLLGELVVYMCSTRSRQVRMHTQPRELEIALPKVHDDLATQRNKIYYHDHAQLKQDGHDRNGRREDRRAMKPKDAASGCRSDVEEGGRGGRVAQGRNRTNMVSRTAVSTP